MLSAFQETRARRLSGVNGSWQEKGSTPREVSEVQQEDESSRQAERRGDRFLQDLRYSDKEEERARVSFHP